MVEANGRTTIYKYNKAFFQWSATFTYKGIKHINLRENMVSRMSSIKGF